MGEDFSETAPCIQSLITGALPLRDGCDFEAACRHVILTRQDTRFFQDSDGDIEIKSNNAHHRPPSGVKQRVSTCDALAFVS
jgi:hypothetical protein